MLARGVADVQGVMLGTLSNVVPNVGSALLALSRLPSRRIVQRASVDSVFARSTM